MIYAKQMSGGQGCFQYQVKAAIRRVAAHTFEQVFVFNNGVLNSPRAVKS